jgi:hypothetical protein
MDIQDGGAKITYLIRDRDVRYPVGFDAVLVGEGIEILRTGVRMPRMNAIMERWIRSCRAELLDRTLIWNRPTCCTPCASTRSATTSIAPTAPSQEPHPCARYPNRSPNHADSSTCVSADATASEASCTSTNTRPDQHGRSSRQLQPSPTNWAEGLTGRPSATGSVSPLTCCSSSALETAMLSASGCPGSRAPSSAPVRTATSVSTTPQPTASSHTGPPSAPRCWPRSTRFSPASWPNRSFGPATAWSPRSVDLPEQAPSRFG